jgi:hypothetical protein
MHLSNILALFTATTSIFVPTIITTESSYATTTLSPSPTIVLVTSVETISTYTYIPTSIQVTLTQTISTSVAIPTHTILANASTEPALGGIYAVAFISSIVVVLIAIAANVNHAKPWAIRFHLAVSAVFITFSFVATVLSAIDFDHPYTREVWGVHSNIAVDIVTLCGAIGGLVGLAWKRRSGGRVDKATVTCSVVIVAVAIFGLTSSVSSIKTFEEKAFGKVSDWWVGFICWLVGLVLYVYTFNLPAGSTTQVEIPMVSQ